MVYIVPDLDEFAEFFPEKLICHFHLTGKDEVSYEKNCNHGWDPGK